MTKRLSAALVLASLSLSACALFADSEPEFNTLEDYYSQQVAWSDCEGFDCAKVAVPADYDNPAGDVIQLSVMRHVAKRSKGTIFMNPGGPGGSGLEYLSGYETQFTDRVSSNFDLVSWDPRGVGESAPVVCTDDAGLDDYLAVDGTPDDSAEEQAMLDSISKLREACLRNSGELLQQISTTNTVRDLDILRAAFGEEKLNYIGKSYGTVIGAVYAHLFPAKVGRLVLDGAVDPQLSSAELALGQAIGFEDALQRFAAYCLENTDICDLGKTREEVVDLVMGIINNLDQQPMKTLDPKRPLVESLAWTSVIGPMYLPDGGWDWLIEGLQFARKGDGSMLLDISDWYNNRDLDGQYLDNATEAFIAITCRDNGPETADLAELETEFTRAAPRFGRLLAWGQSMCDGWPDVSDPLTRDVSAATAPPILVIGTTHDPATPDAWARSLAEELQVGVYLNYNGDGHTAYRSGSKLLDKAVDDFFNTGVVPNSGTVYQPDHPMVADQGEQT